VAAHEVRALSLGWFVHARTGNWEVAEREIRRGYDGLAAKGSTGWLSSVAALRAHCSYALGRLDESLEFSRRCDQLSARDDFVSQVFWRTARAKVLAARGEAAEAVSLAQEAVGLALATDSLPNQGDALLDLAEVLVLTKRHDEARTSARQALDVYERKEHLAGMARARALLEQLDPVRA
jgi:tetratricopeptide (TPR) repeat protein